MRWLWRSSLLTGAALLLFLWCDPPSAKRDAPSSSDQWRAAQEKWRLRDVHAFRAWQQLDPESPGGRLAATLLTRADRHYLEGIRLLESGRSAEGQRALVKGASIAPINPEHYFRLATLYDDRYLDELAVKYYQKYIDALPDTTLAGEAAARIAELSPIFDPPSRERAADTGISWEFLWGFGLALLVVFLLWWLRQDRGVALYRLVERNPELHSAIAFLIGCLRHELLKHRIGAVSDVLTGLESGAVKEAQRAFLANRLYDGAPVRDAWNAHLAAFRGALGHRLSLKRDRAFKRAGRAIRTIQSLQPALNDPDRRTLKRMVKAHQTLKRFDRYLSELQSRLVRTRVDEGLLRQVVDEIGGEYTLSRIRLDALDVDPVPSSVHVEVARNDLILILKNILRNAILAVSKKEQSRVVRMTVKVELEATGDESVHLLVADSADESLDQEKLRHHGVASGLGLVVTAVHRYGGTVAVRPAGGPFKKAVDIRFFRAFEDNQNNGSDR